MDMIGKIRRLHRRDKLSEREIARKTGLARNTVSKWLKGETPKPPKCVRVEKASKLTPFHDAITQALKADARRPRKERRTAKALFAEIKAAGYDGRYSRLTDFLRAWREGDGAASSAKAFVPLAFELGEAFQFDWSDEGLVVGGIDYRVRRASCLSPANRLRHNAHCPELTGRSYRDPKVPPASKATPSNKARNPARQGPSTGAFEAPLGTGCTGR